MLQSDQITLERKEAGGSLSVMAFKEESVNGTNTLSSSANHGKITRCLEDAARMSFVFKNNAEQSGQHDDFVSNLI